MADLTRFDLTGRIALVTGAAQGIGFALARGLGQAGATLVLNDIDEPRLAAALGELRRQGLVVDGQVFDVRKRNRWRRAWRKSRRGWVPIEILVNNAGIQYREPLEEVSPESWREVVDTDLNGVFFVGQAVARQMIGRGHGKIINVTSIFSEYSRPTIASYAAAKAGVKNLTKAMCVEWARHGIQANAIGPGYFVTPYAAAPGRRDVRRLAARAGARRALGGPRRPGRRCGLPGVAGVRFCERPDHPCRRRAALGI